MDYSTLFLDPTRMQKQNVPAISPAFRQELAGVTPVKSQPSQPAPSTETLPVQKAPSKRNATVATPQMQPQQQQYEWMPSFMMPPKEQVYSALPNPEPKLEAYGEYPKNENDYLEMQKVNTSNVGVRMDTPEGIKTFNERGQIIPALSYEHRVYNELGAPVSSPQEGTQYYNKGGRSAGEKDYSVFEKNIPAMEKINAWNMHKQDVDRKYELAQNTYANINEYNTALQSGKHKGSYESFLENKYPILGYINDYGIDALNGEALYNAMEVLKKAGIDASAITIQDGGNKSRNISVGAGVRPIPRAIERENQLKIDKQKADIYKAYTEGKHQSALGQGVLGELPSKVESNKATAAYHRASAGKARAEAENLPTKADALKLSKEIEAKKAQQVAYAKMLDDANKLEGDAREQAIRIANAYAEGKKLVKTKEAIPAEKGWFGFGKKPAIPAEYKEIPIRTEQDLDEEAKASGHSPAAIKAFKKKHGIQ